MKIRENWIDWAKAIGMMLVIMGHYDMGDKMYVTFIYAFHMPLFFIVSGYLFSPPPLLQDNSYKRFVLKNVRSLIVPYFIFGIFSVAASAALNFFSGRDYGVSFFMKSFAGLVLGVPYNTEYTIMNNVPLWFLLALFFVKLICGFFFHYKIFVKISICLSGIAIFMFLKHLGLFLPFSIGNAFLGLPFFLTGVLMREKGFNRIIHPEREQDVKNKISDGKYLWKVVLLFCISTTILYLLILFSSDKPITGFSKFNNVFMWFARGLSGSIMLFTLCMILDKVKSKFITAVSDGTLMIMALHVYGIAAVWNFYKVVSKVFGMGGMDAFVSLPAAVVTAMMITAGLYYPIVFCRRRLPLLLGKAGKKTTRAGETSLPG